MSAAYELDRIGRRILAALQAEGRVRLCEGDQSGRHFSLTYPGHCSVQNGLTTFVATRHARAPTRMAVSDAS